MHYVFSSSGKSINLLLKTKRNAKILLQNQNELIELMDGIVDEQDILPILTSKDRLESFIAFLEQVMPNTFYERDFIETLRTEFSQFEAFFSCFQRRAELEPVKPFSLHKEVLLQNYQRSISNRLQAIENYENLVNARRARPT